MRLFVVDVSLDACAKMCATTDTITSLHGYPAKQGVLGQQATSARSDVSRAPVNEIVTIAPCPRACDFAG
jgi:hypothetical protein